MMSTAEERLRKVMPTKLAPLSPTALIDSVVVAGGVAYVSGQVGFVGTAAPLLGKVGAGVTVEQAVEEAGKAAANGLYRLVEALGSFESIERILKVTVFVNAVDDFTEQPAVANGATRMLIDVLGDTGRHARSAVGVGSLPLGVPVEVEMVAKVTS